MPLPSLRLALGLVGALSLLLATAACSASDAVGSTPSDAGADVGADHDANARDPVVLVTPTFDTPRAIYGLAPGPEGSLLVTMDGPLSGVNLARLDGDGNVMWVRPVGYGSAVATAAPDRIVAQEVYGQDGRPTGPRLIVFDAKGTEVTRLALPIDGFLRSLEPVPGGGVMGISIEQSGDVVLVSWDGKAPAVTTRVLTIDKNRHFYDPEALAVDGLGVGWLSSQGRLMRIAPGALGTEIDAASVFGARLLARPEGGVVARIDSGFGLFRADGTPESTQTGNAIGLFRAAAYGAGKVVAFGLSNYASAPPSKNQWANTLAIVDGPSNRDITFRFSNLAKMQAATYAGGRFWVGGAMSGSLTVGKRTIEAPDDLAGAWLLGFTDFTSLGTSMTSGR